MRPTSNSFGGACRFLRGAAIAGLTIAGFAWSSFGAAQADPLLDEMVEFTGQIFFIDTKVPAVVIGAVRNGEVSVRGFGERAGPGSPRRTATRCSGSAPSPRRSPVLFSPISQRTIP